MKKEKHISIALEEKTYIRLKALAEEDKRAVANLVRYIIILYIRGIENGAIQLSIYTMPHKQ